MIKFSNGRAINYFIASGALAYDCKGWLHERALTALGFINPRFFAVAIKSLTLPPTAGHLVWWHPWTCIRMIQNGAVNKVGLTNPGFNWWVTRVAPYIDFESQPVIVSLFGSPEDLVYMAERLNPFDLLAIEVNGSCPNKKLLTSGLPQSLREQAEHIAQATIAAKTVSRHPFIQKVSYEQAYFYLESRLRGVVEAISINSVKHETVFPDEQSPLCRLENRVGGGGGGVSGKPAQLYNWKVVSDLKREGKTPIIAPSSMSYEDMQYVRNELGADGVSFGTIMLPDHNPFKVWTWLTNPTKPTRYVRRAQREQIAAVIKQQKAEADEAEQAHKLESE
ncbi:MAG: hypothetical protein KGI59_02400 [Patescibacteria group bacterium]|nr:hypothetical protein [Patescibacteria group bacterium]MDE2172378.1 hypothetical protein [Patescibacteria group bacterium]